MIASAVGPYSACLLQQELMPMHAHHVPVLALLILKSVCDICGDHVYGLPDCQ